ncbi:hypothetical protein EW145_g3358 [Phellinidium pouzarii]|uniref:Major facilitator superfamily (MFS) profile domain-containing protein n=1 Tax=Phellinidium pouzarii TaxID=167371 RepID=A0A4S4L7E0_9AGAM|nr:hypothetical protein EW145_g3358 [Phellinidium pouzarii]
MTAEEKGAVEMASEAPPLPPPPVNRRSVLLAVFIAFGGFLFGYDIGGCLIMPDFIMRFGQSDGNGGFVLSSSRQSIITSLLSAGTFVGALAQALTSDRFGRRGSILIWSAIFTVGVAVQTGTTFSIVQITIGRFIAGLGVGALSAIVPLYNGETAPKRIRGTMLVLYQLQIIMGIFLSYVIDLGTHSIKSSASWRIPVGLQLLWGLILLSEARRVIAELNSVPEDDLLVLDLIAEIDEGIHAENNGGKATWLECFSARSQLWKRTINGMMLQFIQQLNGQNFYYYYGDTFFKSAGTQLSPYVIQTILGAVSVVGTLPALYLIETWGRRKSLLTGAVMEAVCSLIVSSPTLLACLPLVVYPTLTQPPQAGVAGFVLLPSPGTDVSTITLTSSNKRGGDVLIAFAILHVFSYSIFWGPTPWVYLGESFPLRVRAKCIALGSATNWIWNFLLSFFAPRIAARIGPLILLIFFGMLVFGYVFVYFAIPEVKGLSLEEVDELYRSGVRPWRSASWRPSGKGVQQLRRVEGERLDTNVIAVDEVRERSRSRWNEIQIN